MAKVALLHPISRSIKDAFKSLLQVFKHVDTQTCLGYKLNSQLLVALQSYMITYKIKKNLGKGSKIDPKSKNEEVAFVQRLASTGN